MLDPIVWTPYAVLQWTVTERPVVALGDRATDDDLVASRFAALEHDTLVALDRHADLALARADAAIRERAFGVTGVGRGELPILVALGLLVGDLACRGFACRRARGRPAPDR